MIQNKVAFSSNTYVSALRDIRNKDNVYGNKYELVTRVLISQSISGKNDIS